MLTAAQLTSQPGPSDPRDEDVPFHQQLLQVLPTLRRRAGMLSSDPSVAEDLLNDVIERALSRRRHLRPGSNLCAWLTVVMKNLVVDGYRRERVQASALRSLNRTATVPAESTPEETWESLAPCDVANLVARLGSPLRETTELVLLHRRSYRDVAAQLGVPVATVGTRLARARKKLRALVTAGAPAGIEAST